MKITLIKKNRKYFAAKNSTGYDCKVIIDTESENLELGKELELAVDDLSVRSKYGTDLIYKIKSEISAAKGICTLRHRFNEWLVTECRNLGGIWDREENAWIFSKIVDDKVEELDAIWNSESVSVELTAKERISVTTDSVSCYGYIIAKAMGRDSGSKLGEEVCLISGSITSGGSVKNWSSVVTEGTVLRTQFPKEVIEKYILDERWSLKLI